MIDHYIDGVPTPAWLEAMREIESEESWTPAQPVRYIVSMDFISGCADRPAREAA